jgi:hypothetical protein
MAFLIRILLILYFVTLPSTTFAADREQALKTAYIYQISRFVDWPNISAPSFNICILSNNDFFQTTSTFFKRKRIHKKPVNLIKVDSDNIPTTCQVVFIDKTYSNIKLDTHSGVLTISDKKDFSVNSGAIELFIVQNKLRFSINNSIAQKSGLRIRPQLLDLAQVVHSGENGQ